MAIYTTDTDTAYTSTTGQAGSKIVEVFIDAAAKGSDTTFSIKEENGGVTFTTTKAMAKEIADTFSFAADDEEDDEELAKALNQVISLVAGRDLAIATNEYADNPKWRIGEVNTLAAMELVKASQAGDVKLIKQVTRKLESLASLQKIANAIG